MRSRPERTLEPAGRRKARRVQAVIYTLLLGIVVGLFAFINQPFLKQKYQWRVVTGPSLLTSKLAEERAAKPGSNFKDCINGCPTMIVVPAGKFTMGSPETEKDRLEDEGPQHEVTIATPLAVSRTDATFAEWDICVAAGGCLMVSDYGWGRGDRPVILVSWEEAKGYVRWLTQMTGKDYRLLTESEWEYAARAGSQARWSFGDDESHLGDYAWYAQNSEGKTQPVGTKKPDAFGLYDMHGNVWQWVEDCYHAGYQGAPSDGSARIEQCSARVVRGGSWGNDPRVLRSASRTRDAPDGRYYSLGFRVGRTLTP